MPLLRVAAGLALTVSLVTVDLRAQAGNEPCALAGRPSIGYFLFPMKDHPLSARIKLSLEQALPGGNRIALSTFMKIARDSAGRTMTEEQFSCTLNANGVPTPVTRIQISDPVGGRNMNWVRGDNNGEIVQIRHQTTPSLPAPLPPRQTPEQLAGRKLYAERLREETVVEDLGNKTILGVEAKGSRSTRTIPPAEAGSLSPIVVKDEVWRSTAEQNLILLSISDDPRTGRRTQEVVELNQSVPDPTLFEVPKGMHTQEYESTVKIISSPPTDSAAQ
jgi:hypothetical protein